MKSQFYEGDDHLSKYELSLSKDYVPNWTVVDAVREIFQNALDQEATNENNEMFFDYDESQETLFIGNKSSILNVSTLLLGKTTKRNDEKTIGQFGEGYKIATLVLTRLNKKVTFYNYGAKEVWTSRFVKARRYNGEEVLTFFVDRKYVWNKVPDNNLTISVEGITPEEYQEIVDSNLHLQDVGNVIETSVGRILEEERYKGKVYVNGLFVCVYEAYHQGYDFKPQYIKIDRDRKLADSFELKWLSSRMLASVDSDKTVKLIEKQASDVEFLSSFNEVDPFGEVNQKLKNIHEKTHQSFIDQNGQKAIPVSNQEEFNEIALMGGGFKPILVSRTHAEIIRKSDNYNQPEEQKNNSEPVSLRLKKWLTQHKQSLSKKAIYELESIIANIIK